MLYEEFMRNSILDSLREDLLTRSPLVALPEEVWKRTGALNTWGTNAIEGNTLNQRDVEMLLLEDRSVGNRPLADVMETVQHDASFRGLLHRLNEPIRMTTALELHEQVFHGIDPEAGMWRRITVFLQESRRTPPRAEAVIPSMSEWEREYSQRDIVGERVFTLAAWMHHRFESIHPFRDGNGRVGRLLLNLHFLRHSWPPLHILPPDRKAYLDALEAGHSGDSSQLAGFLRVRMAGSLLDLLNQVGTSKDELRPLRELGERGPYSAKYLTLRAGQGAFPAVKRGHRYHASERALGLYRDEVGRR
jgi:Fic family protein